MQRAATTAWSLRDLSTDQARTEALTLSVDGLYLDATRQLLDVPTWQGLLELAEATAVPAGIAAMAAGTAINTTEGRSVLHTALRSSDPDRFQAQGEPVGTAVAEVRQQVAQFAEAVRSGAIVGATGKPLRNVVAIGIGGSYLGPAFVAETLAAEPVAAAAADSRQLRFIANVDPVDGHRVLADLDPLETLVVIISKTFTTVETMMNATVAKQWLLDAVGESGLSHHLAAVSTNAEAVAAFGIDTARMFGFWDWVGGRYSVSSAVGLVPLMLHFGVEVVDAFLVGAEAMDQHFFTAPLAENMPVWLGLLGVWNSTFLGHRSRALLPYQQALHRFAAHIQQVDMESNGKAVDRSGAPLSFVAGEVDFGEPGTNAQHSFMQLIHQGQVVPVDVIGVVEPQHDATSAAHPVSLHQELLCNMLAQVDALAFGKTAEEVRAAGVPEELVSSKVFSGNRPSNLLLLPRLDAFTCGQLLALYEHRTAVQGFVWGINSFDQMGVELGKVLAGDLRQRVSGAGEPNLEGLSLATAAAVQRCFG
jgi:glucose-6-phosphate isomerase